VLTGFCLDDNCSDGAYPRSSVIRDANGNIYGTASEGGTGSCRPLGCGVVFSLIDGQKTILHAFINAPDGLLPGNAPLLQDARGNLYGTTTEGGTCCGTIFKVTLSGEETILYNFTDQDDGVSPRAGLITDGKGHAYGTTSISVHGSGTVFEISQQ
jgi:uncharacterized repeat protein (TIGR03803 family)